MLALLLAAWEHSRRQAFRKGLLGGSQDDLRDNILNYNEQGGGEEDQVRRRAGAAPPPVAQCPPLPRPSRAPGLRPTCAAVSPPPQDAYDINQLRNPGLLLPPSPRGKPPCRRDAPYGFALPRHPRRAPACSSDIEDFINEVSRGRGGDKGGRVARGREGEGLCRSPGPAASHTPSHLPQVVLPWLSFAPCWSSAACARSGLVLRSSALQSRAAALPVLPGKPAGWGESTSPSLLSAAFRLTPNERGAACPSGPGLPSPSQPL